MLLFSISENNPQVVTIRELSLLVLFFCRVKIKGMVVNADAENFLDGLLYRLNSRIAKFDYFPGVAHDNVIVLFVEIGFLIMSLILAKLMASHQTAFQ